MKVQISIRVRNPEWYWSKEEMKENGDYREEWEMINEGKIYKHMPTMEFDFNFEVKEYQEADEDTFDIEIYLPKDGEIDKENPVRVQLEDVRVINFYGETDQCSVVISNSIIHDSDIKKPRGKYYFYFYIKEDAEYEVPPQNENIWLDSAEIQRLVDLHGPVAIKPQERIHPLGATGQMSAPM